MAKEIKTEILINASPDKVWAVLTNFNEYPDWNPFIKSLEGDVEVGEKIKVVIQAPRQNAMTFKPKVLSYEANKEFSWIGHLLIPGLFDGAHHFELIDNGDGTTTFRQSEHFKGILLGMLNPENTQKGFELMNEKLKELAEEK